MEAPTEVHFPTELFIDEVKERPSIWDIRCEEFKNRDLKKQQWFELCQQFCPNFETITSPKRKREMCSNLKNKWRNIRDSYRKHWKSIKSTKSGQARKDKKQYVYAHQLLFLDDTMELVLTEGPPNIFKPSAPPNLFKPNTPPNLFKPSAPNTTENCDEDELQSKDERSSRSATKSRESSVSLMYRHAKKGLESKIEKCIDSFEANQKQKCGKDEGDDLHFFKSLLPVVQPLPLQKKLKFRIEVMNLAMEYAERN